MQVVKKKSKNQPPAVTEQLQQQQTNSQSSKQDGKKAPGLLGGGALMGAREQVRGAPGGHGARASPRYDRGQQSTPTRYSDRMRNSLHDSCDSLYYRYDRGHQSTPTRYRDRMRNQQEIFYQVRRQWLQYSL